MRGIAHIRRRSISGLSRRLSVLAFATALLTSGALMPVQDVHAQSLPDALSAAYLFNPTLKAARAQLRATDEEVARAKSGYRPTITGDAAFSAFSQTNNLPGGVGEGTFETRSYGVTLTQPIFRGFRTINQVRGAEALVESGREDLRSAEQLVLLNAVTAYVDVVRDAAIVTLRQNDVKALQEQLRATQDRFEVGEVTKTDVAQARARVSAATSAVAAARAQLQASRGTFAQIIGRAPANLRDPGPARIAPPSLEEALAIGEGENPDLLSLAFRERAQDHVVKQTKGELLPQVNLQASFRRDEGGPALGNDGFEETATVTGVVTVPIYEGGEVYARIRQNIETRSQLRHQIDEQREAVRANVIDAWGQYSAARAQIPSDQAQVDATQVALTGVREEEKVGQRTILDVLNAEQELLNARVNLITSRRNLVVASYSLLREIGRLSVATIGLGVEQYDPNVHYNEVKNKWIGWSTSTEASEPEPQVAPVRATGRAPGQPAGDGPAYTGTVR
jgi:outer membrane protein